jgi:hypothetical protein
MTRRNKSQSSIRLDPVNDSGRIEELIRHLTVKKYPKRPYTVVQPDYRKWERVQIGMSRAEVIELLGEPIAKYRGASIFPDSLFGFLDLPLMPDSLTYNFTVGFDSEARVFRKSDPFHNQLLSADGLPSKPEIIGPPEGASFTHYPRLLDIRWGPCSGQYPIEYRVEIGLTGSDRYYPVAIGLLATHWVHQFPGSQPGQVRVRASNELGDGEWSEPRNFRF